MNQETKRCYFEDPYRVEFEANVIDRATYNEKPALILDQTCFYPESGGQPADKGTINNIKVIDVIEDSGKILHILEKEVTDAKIIGKIDWDVRFDHMQQHAGQHILSQCFHKLLEGKTLSFHLGEDSSSVEIDLKKISDEEVEKVEERANEVVFQNREIKTYFIQEDQIQGIPLRKPSLKKGSIRVVEVAEFDHSACGGTHPRTTGEIGLIKILKSERIRNNIRFEFVCGGKALRDYMMKNKILRQIAVRFTVSEQETMASIEKLSSDFKTQKKKMREIQKKVLRFEAQEIIKDSKEKIIKDIFKERTAEDIKLLALNIIKKGDYVVLFGLELKDRAHLVLGCSENLDLDMRELIPVVSSVVGGKGGGRPSFVEISGQELEKIDLALGEAYKFIKSRTDF